jgi:hypothetical protein
MIRIILPALALAACAQTPPPAEETPVRGDTGYTCNAESLAELVGQPATAELGTAALDRSGSRSLRWIQPGTAVTMDYRQDRLNIHLDERNAVTKFTCG